MYRRYLYFICLNIGTLLCPMTTRTSREAESQNSFFLSSLLTSLSFFLFLCLFLFFLEKKIHEHRQSLFLTYLNVWKRRKKIWKNWSKQRQLRCDVTNIDTEQRQWTSIVVKKTTREIDATLTSDFYFHVHHLLMLFNPSTWKKRKTLLQEKPYHNKQFAPSRALIQEEIQNREMTSDRQ